MALQRKDYTLSDFFGDWLKTKRNLEMIGHDLARSILENMKKRESRILDNKLMLATVYLDPRYNFILNENQKTSAVIYLCELWCRLNEINPQENIISEEETDEFAKFLSNSANVPQQLSITHRIEQFLQRPPINYKTNIIEYWEKLKCEEAELFKLRVALFAVAPTQVDVERSFSSLTFIFNNYRSRLNTELLSQLLILRLNYDLAPTPSDLNCFRANSDTNEP